MGEVTDHQIRYYEERAKGGVGLIITEFTTIDYEYGKGAVNQLRIDKDGFVPEFNVWLMLYINMGRKYLFSFIMQEENPIQR